jgi:hypothetical protein
VKIEGGGGKLKHFTVELPDGRVLECVGRSLGD